MKANVSDPKAANPTSEPLLSVRDLSVTFRRPDGSRFSVVDRVTFEVRPGEVVGIVGESGSGKSLTARSLLHLVPKGGLLGGTVQFCGRDISAMSGSQLRDLRGGKISMVFQDAMTSFNPVLRIGDQIGEAIELHSNARGSHIRRRVVALLEMVGIRNAKLRAQAYPHEFSGGMRQRALTAMALANDPILLIADEPTTALDVTVQDQVMDLLRTLHARGNTAVLMITHNIAVVASLCSRIIVMYAGRIVEDGPVEEVLSRPAHPYTQALLRSVPHLRRSHGRLPAIAGQPPDPAALPSGCKFSPRCPIAKPPCFDEEPLLEERGHEHRARCLFPLNSAEVLS